LILGLVLVVVALTGAALVFRTQLERRVDAARFVVTPGTTRLAADDLVGRAKAAHAAGELESVRYYGDPTMPFLVYFTNKEYVHLDPYTGVVLGVRQRYGEGFGWVEGLHKFLQLDPSVGEMITGYSALVFGLITVTGIVLWWPATRRALVAGLTLNWKLKGRPWNLSLHKVLGIYAAAVLLFSALSGVPISLDWAKNALYPLTASQKVPPPTGNPAEKVKFAGFTAAAATVAQQYPAARETYIPLPKKGIVSAYAIEADADHAIARSYVWLEPGSAHVIKATPYRQAPAGFRLYYWMMSLHTGVAGGPLWQIILLLGALSVPVLAYTGTASYLKRKAGKSAAPKARAASALSDEVTLTSTANKTT
jgi:vanillate O-demethylase ferredoxin subunit